MSRGSQKHLARHERHGATANRLNDDRRGVGQQFEGADITLAGRDSSQSQAAELRHAALDLCAAFERYLSAPLLGPFGQHNWPSCLGWDRLVERIVRSALFVA